MLNFDGLKYGDKIKSKVNNEILICVEFAGTKVLKRDPHPFPYGISMFALNALNPNDWELVKC